MHDNGKIALGQGMGFFSCLKRKFCSFRQEPVSVEPEHVVRQRRLTTAYDELLAISKLNGIRAINFSAGAATMTLADGRKYRFDMHEPAARLYSVPYDGTFEAKETEFLRREVKPGMTCIDAGGSFGWYTVLLSRLVGPSGKVYSFEPLPANFRQLEANIALNQCQNVQLECVALSDSAGERELFLPDIGVSGSFELHQYDKSFEKISCSMMTLDQYCQNQAIDKVDFIKADIEGAEWLLLKGASNVIERERPMLFLEIQAHSTRLFGYEPCDVFAWLVERGYRPFWVDPANGLKHVFDPSGVLPDHNFIFIAEAG